VVAQAPQQPPTAANPISRQVEQNEPAQEMRNLIRDISKYARRFNPNFGIITEGGLELLEKEDPVDPTQNSPARTYMKSFDGINILGLNFHPPLKGKGNIITDKKIKKKLLRLSDLGQKRGLKIFTTDFATDLKTTQESYNLNLTKGYIPFTAKSVGMDYVFDSISDMLSRPINENSQNISGLKNVKNYLYLTDSSNFDRQQDFVIAVSNTNYDIIFLDVFHKGRTPYSKAAIQGMKFKKLGARRLVFAYMNIGAAENYRYYWRDSWREGEPPFISETIPANPDRHYVEYWQAGWRRIITGNTNSYIYGIIKQGFDGVILGGLDSFMFFESGG
jgi:cysteinyl-tRNA synthetase